MRVIDISAIRGRKIRRPNAMEGKHLFRGGFVLGKKMGMRPGTRVRNAQQIYIRGHVHFFGVVAGVRLREVEDQLSAAFAQTIKRLWTAVQHVIRRFVPQLAERVENLFAVFLLFALAPGFCRRLRFWSFLFTPDVIQHGDFEFVTHSTSSVPHHA